MRNLQFYASGKRPMEHFWIDGLHMWSVFNTDKKNNKKYKVQNISKEYYTQWNAASMVRLLRAWALHIRMRTQKAIRSLMSNWINRCRCIALMLSYFLNWNLGGILIDLNSIHLILNNWCSAPNTNLAQNRFYKVGIKQISMSGV